MVKKSLIFMWPCIIFPLFNVGNGPSPTTRPPSRSRIRKNSGHKFQIVSLFA
jgi:hypothetical protein